MRTISHWLKRLLREGGQRTSPPVSLSSFERQSLEAHFDVEFYLSNNLDVKRANVDPLLHYHTHGWHERRNPSRDFDTDYYLRSNPDVFAAEINPLLHYAYSGHAEGRPSRDPNPEISIIEPHFDRVFYNEQYKDLPSGVDEVWHYCAIGWKQKRDPCPGFDTDYYLSTNLDVFNANINPFLHYIIAGKDEGRNPVRPLRLERDIISRSYADAKIVNIIEPALLRDYPECDFTELMCSLRSLCISISHDNYLRSTGGVQTILREEEEYHRNSGLDYLHLSPAMPLNSLSPQSADPLGFVFSVQYNGQELGYASAEQIISVLKPRGRTSRAIVHHLLGHDPEVIAALIDAVAMDEPTIWLHDFFTACTNYALMRNGVSFCGAPPLNSHACTICAFGHERRIHLGRIQALLRKYAWSAIAPSSSAADNIMRMLPSHFNYVAVRQPASLRFHGVRERRAGKVRVAHLGARSYVKGWAHFSELASRLSEDDRYEFYQLGSSDGLPINERIRHVPVLVTGHTPTAMIDALSGCDIDIALIWSLAAETFSYTTHEALAAGAFVVTRRGAGNVWPAVESNAPLQGLAYESFEDLYAGFRSGTLIAEYEAAVLSVGSLVSSYRGSYETPGQG